MKLDLVNLRPLEQDDVEDIYAFRNHPDVMMSLGGFSKGYSKQDVVDWIEYHRMQKDEVLWAISALETNRCVGHVGFYKIDHRIRKAEFAILIGDPAWRGQGLGSTITRAVLNYGFDELNLHKIDLSVLEGNETALRLYERLGFKKDGRLRHEQFRNGKYVDLLIMSLLDHERPKEG